ncbi:MAG TPA: hypothetical protein VFL73_02950 [Solirubrobacteraceae bacterium]|nr:hypothetical protein [Solirubrobacteraceae bacterium]
MSARQLQARYALAHRYRPNEDHTALKRELKAAQLAEHIERVVNEAPPLTPEQRDRLAVLLRGGEAA